MCTLRPFIRIHGIQPADVDEFVKSVSGKNLSIRSIELLAQGYFKGPDALRGQIKSGHITWALSRLKDSLSHSADCSQLENVMIRDLEIVSKYMQRVSAKARSLKFKTNAFFAQANVLSGGILRQTDSFLKAIRDLYDRSGQT